MVSRRFLIVGYAYVAMPRLDAIPQLSATILVGPMSDVDPIPRGRVV